MVLYLKTSTSQSHNFAAFTSPHLNMPTSTQLHIYTSRHLNSSLNMFPSNKQSEFTVKLSHPIEIDKECWEVALVEIVTPSEVFNIAEDNNFFVFGFS